LISGVNIFRDKLIKN